MNEILAVVVTYNRKDMLVKCIDSLRKQTYSDFDILIVDNNSTDGTDETIKPYLSTTVKYHKLSENIGGAGGFNYGMRYSVENDYKYCWVMDDDTLPLENALSELVKADEVLDKNYGVLSSVVLWTDGKECKMNRQKLKKDFYEDVDLLKNGLIRFEQATFVSLFVPTKTIQKVGLPIKEFFIWGDDIEYTRRVAVRKQMNSYIVGKSQVIHAMDSNKGSSIATDNENRINRYNHAFRNENFLYRKEGLKGFIYYFSKCGINCIRVLRSEQSKKMNRLWIIFKNLFLGFFFNPRIETIERTKYDSK
ncbi:MAG: glycosyltransferase family 2 protein [Anaerorhabdus sp.]